MCPDAETLHYLPDVIQCIVLDEAECDVVFRAAILMPMHLLFPDLSRSSTFFTAFLYFFIYPTSQYWLPPYICGLEYLIITCGIKASILVYFYG